MAFDGNNSTKIGNNTVSITWDIASAPITVTDKIEVRARSASSNASQTNFKVNGSDVGQIIGGDSWYTVSGPVTLNTLTWGDDPDDNSKSTDVGAIRIDGELLVDPGFGGNGFYLPFDPAQTGANYSSGSETNLVLISNTTIQNVFDGDITKGGAVNGSKSFACNFTNVTVDNKITLIG